MVNIYFGAETHSLWVAIKEDFSVELTFKLITEGSTGVIQWNERKSIPDGGKNIFKYTDVGLNARGVWNAKLCISSQGPAQVESTCLIKDTDLYSKKQWNTSNQVLSSVVIC